MLNFSCIGRKTTLFLFGALATVACKQNLTASNTESAKAQKAQKPPRGDVSYDVSDTQIVIKFLQGDANDIALKIFGASGNSYNTAVTNEEKTLAFSCPEKKCQMVVPMTWGDAQNGRTGRLFDLDGRIVLYWSGMSAEKFYNYLREGLTSFGDAPAPNSGILVANFGGVMVNGLMTSKFSLGCGFTGARDGKQDFSCKLYMNPNPELLNAKVSTLSSTEGATRSVVLEGHDASYMYSRFRLAGDDFNTATPSFKTIDLKTPAKNVSLVSVACEAKGLARSCRISIDTTYMNYDQQKQKNKDVFKGTPFEKTPPPTKIYTPSASEAPSGTVRAELSPADSANFFRAFGRAYGTYFMKKEIEESDDLKNMNSVALFTSFDDNVSIGCGKTDASNNVPTCMIQIKK